MFNELISKVLTNPKKPSTALMYHSIGNQIKGWPWRLSTKAFEKHLQIIKFQGWRTDVLSNYLFCKPKVNHLYITFDDGFLDNMDAVELLKNYGMKATLFITICGIGKTAFWEREFSRLPMLSQSQIKHISSMGMEIGSHGIHHYALEQLSPNDIHYELSVSKRRLEKLIGNPVAGLAYPHGRYNERVINIAREIGYSYACTTESGSLKHSKSEFQLKRLSIFSKDGNTRFAGKLSLSCNNLSFSEIGHYGWNICKRRCFKIG